MKSPEIIIISALAESSRAIGKNGKLPWKIPKDSKRFQDLTIGYPVIMGRKTWEYDLEKRPLKRRFNIVVSSAESPDQTSEFCSNELFELAFVQSLDDALKIALRTNPRKIFIAGGASIYAQALPLADVLELTLVEGEFEGDTFFPAYQHLIGSHFELVNRDCHPGFRFETYRRVPVETWDHSQTEEWLGVKSAMSTSI